MKSIQFPDMFNSNSTKICKDLNATKQNTLLLLYTEKGEHFGDPYLGIRLKRYLFEQNNYILKDIIIDEIYTQLSIFLPQLIIDRRDIEITADRAKIYCNFRAKNKIDFKVNSYNLVLYDEENL